MSVICNQSINQSKADQSPQLNSAVGSSHFLVVI